jgi:RNA polymerase sigma factor (sigma-70 family)
MYIAGRGSNRYAGADAKKKGVIISRPGTIRKRVRNTREANMATAQSATLVRYLRKLAASRCLQECTDRQLLDHFVAGRDDTGFTALVARHGPMVLRVCRRVLNHEQDAEDAFQATFLVLARKARSIHKPEALAEWLHGVAYRTAMKAKRTAARRRNHEARLRTLRSKAAASPIWGDVQSVLDEEIQRLPQAFRTAFVLCVLEGQTAPQAAARLGIRPGTVSSRLTRARQLLQQRLARRGIKLAALLTALSLVENAGKAELPGMLVQVTVRSGLLVAAGKTAAGMIPPHIAALAAGVIKAMYLSKAKVATAVLLAVCLFTTGAGVLTHQAFAVKEPPAVVKHQEPRHSKGDPKARAERPNPQPGGKDQEGAMEVTGQVLDPEGRPVAGARLYSPQAVQEQPAAKDQVAVIQQGTTGKDGRFKLSLLRKDAPRRQPVTLIAAADGFGLDWVELPQDGAPGEVTFRLVRDVPIHGRILSTEGKPIAGVTIKVDVVMDPGKLDDFLKALERGWRAAETMMAKQLTLPLTKALRVTASDKEGRFEIAGAGAERLVSLQMTHPALAVSDLLVVTHEGTDVKALNDALAKPASRRDPRINGYVPVLRGPSFEHIAEPGRVIEGTVREAGTGKPVAGATIQANGNAAVTAVVSDARGHYRIIGLRKAQRYVLRINPPVDMPLVGSEMAVSDTSALLEPIQADLELSPGGVVIGRVLDKANGQGVEGFVQFVPLPDNPFAGKATRSQALATFTDADGRFRLGTIPGPGVLLTQVSGTRETSSGVRVHPYPVIRYQRAEFSPDDRKRVQVTDQPQAAQSFNAAGGERISLEFFNACKVVDVKEGSEPVSCDLVVDPGRTLTLNLQDTEGKPLAGGIVWGTSAMSVSAISLKDSICPVYALNPGHPRQLVLLHPQRELAGTITLRGDETGPLPVRLGRAGAVTGRVVDMDGQPVQGANVAAVYSGQVGRELVKELQRRDELPRTDENGRFRLGGIVPGRKFEILLAKGQQRLEREARADVGPLEAGKNLNLGDIRVKSQP